MANTITIDEAVCIDLIKERMTRSKKLAKEGDTQEAAVCYGGAIQMASLLMMYGYSRDKIEELLKQ